MKRRNFFKCAALAGMSLSVPLGFSRAGAQSAGYGGPYFIQINAGGGWDPRFMFDPILDPTQNRLYTEIGKVGNISFAPIPLNLDALDVEAGSGAEAYLLTNEQFLNRHGGRLTVFNGVDMETNNHDAGSRAIWSGQLSEGYPSIGALVAAAKAPDSPMAFLSAGGYDATEGLIPLTRVSSADNMRKLAFPNMMDPGEADSDRYHSPATWAMIQSLQAERLAAMEKGQNLPKVRQSMADLRLARTNDRALEALVIPENLVEADYYGGSLQRNMQQAQIAIAAFGAGIAVSLNLDIGGFDTHSNHDIDQPARIVQILTLVDFVHAELEKAGMSDKTYIFVGSDFARGPFYNGDRENSGKDHWPVGSFLAMGPGIAGDRVIGATTSEQRALGVDPKSLAVMENGGTVIKATHIQKAIRGLAGVDAVADDYQLPGATLPLFG